MSQADSRKSAIAARLFAVIRRSGMSQGALASRLGVSRSALSSWVVGRYQPPLETLVDICRAVGASADEVLGLKPAPPSLDVRRALDRCDRLEAGVERELAALRAEIERLRG